VVQQARCILLCSSNYRQLLTLYADCGQYRNFMMFMLPLLLNESMYTLRLSPDPQENCLGFFFLQCLDEDSFESMMMSSAKLSEILVVSMLEMHGIARVCSSRMRGDTASLHGSWKHQDQDQDLGPYKRNSSSPHPLFPSNSS
jgi:hypothetical protein